MVSGMLMMRFGKSFPAYKGNQYEIGESYKLGERWPTLAERACKTERVSIRLTAAFLCF